MTSQNHRYHVFFMTLKIFLIGAVKTHTDTQQVHFASYIMSVSNIEHIGLVM